MTFREQALYFTFGAASATEVIGVATVNPYLAAGGVLAVVLTVVAMLVASYRDGRRAGASAQESK